MAIKTVYVNPGDFVVFKTIDPRFPPNPTGFKEQHTQVEFRVKVEDKYTLKVDRTLRPQVIMGSFFGQCEKHETLCGEVL